MKFAAALCMLFLVGCATGVAPTWPPDKRTSLGPDSSDPLGNPLPADSGVVRLVDSRMIQEIIRSGREANKLSLSAGKVVGYTMMSLVILNYVNEELEEDDESNTHCEFGAPPLASC